MKSKWESSWTKVPGGGKSGGQGTSSVVARKGDGSSKGFLKVLTKQRDGQARKRFAREVVTYETLEHEGIPRLLEHNGTHWNEAATDLYLVLELIEGPTLAELVRRDGPMATPSAFVCISILAGIVGYCHNQYVVHRDLKPRNVILRDGEVARPFVIDFGLTYNDLVEGVSDVTRVGEEVGNRFLRLPEHASGGRSYVSDVTQLAGLLFFVLTGIEPRVLIDEAGDKPHQRAESTANLAGRFEGRQLLRIQSLFDKAFDIRLPERFQSTRELTMALNAVTSPTSDEPDYPSLMSRLDEVAGQPERAQLAANNERLQACLRIAMSVVTALAERKSLERTQTGHQVDAWAATPCGETRLAMAFPSHPEKTLVTYRFELRGPKEIVFLADGVERWRGTDVSTRDLVVTIEIVATEAFLRDNP